MTGSVLPGQVAFHSISKTITVGLQTRLLCIPKKPCLRCKEALFGGQRSLVFNAGVLTSSFVAWIVRLPSRPVRFVLWLSCSFEEVMDTGEAVRQDTPVGIL